MDGQLGAAVGVPRMCPHTQTQALPTEPLCLWGWMLRVLYLNKELLLAHPKGVSWFNSQDWAA